MNTGNEVEVFAKWRIKEGALQNVLSLLEIVVEKSRAEEGNLFYHVHLSTTDENTLILHEGYQNESAIEAHRNADHFQTVVIDQIVPLLVEREVSMTTRKF